MIALPVRREPAPLAVRSSAAARPHPKDDDATPSAPGGDTIPTPDDQAVAEQQRAFDQMAALMAERQREANVIRDMAMAQLKRDEDVLKKWIEMI